MPCPRHLLIHNSFVPRKVCCKHRAEEPCYALTLLANLEESGAGISHEVGLAALRINGYADFGYYYLVTLGKGYGTSVDGLLLIFAANLSSASCTLCCCSSSTACDIAAARSCSSSSTVSSSTATFFLHDIVLHHIRHDEAITTHNDDEHKHGLIA